MPFKVNPLIEAVDPVKIYEYLLFGNFIIAPDYIELDKFGDLICRYKTSNEFFYIIQLILRGDYRKNDRHKNIEFLAENRWSIRQELINQELKRVLS
jgi:hypothetical protein